MRFPTLKFRPATHVEIVNPPEPDPIAFVGSLQADRPIELWRPSIRHSPKSASALNTLAVSPCAHWQPPANESPRKSTPQTIAPAIKTTRMIFPKTLIRDSFPSPTSDDLCHGYLIIRLYSN